MAPENNCWGAGAVKVPTVSGVQQSSHTIPIVLPKKTTKKDHGFYEVPTVHRNSAKFLGATAPKPPTGDISAFSKSLQACNFL